VPSATSPAMPLSATWWTWCDGSWAPPGLTQLYTYHECLPHIMDTLDPVAFPLPRPLTDEELALATRLFATGLAAAGLQKLCINQERAARALLDHHFGTTCYWGSARATCRGRRAEQIQMLLAGVPWDVVHGDDEASRELGAW